MAASARPTSLSAILTLTFLCSIGSAVVYGGVFFLAKEHYGFNERQNFLLGLLYGVMYIPAALGIGPFLRWIGTKGVPPRTMLMALMASMGLVCFIPWAAAQGNVSSTWPVWLTVGIYSPLSGALWPMVESFLAGGRSERELRSVIGKFNICWSSSIVVSMLAISPFISEALVILNTLGVVHLACIGVAFMFTPAPGAHAHAEHNPPLLYRQLLKFLRIMLPVSFMFIATLSPYMPYATASLGLKDVLGGASDRVLQAAAVIIAATWYASRVGTFFLMERWHGWHGRWWTPIAGSFVLLLSFAFLVITPLLTSGPIGITLFVLGLIAFGAGVGVIYASALYYAMEVGSDGVDAGGMHETLIGIGYSVGPACGLLSLTAASQGLVKPDQYTFVMLAAVSSIALIAGAWALAKAKHMAQAEK